MRSHPSISCAILVGGQSRRFGRDKALAVLDGETLIGRAVRRLAEVSDDVMIVGNRLDRFVGVPARLVHDEIQGLGVLAGIYTSLRSARHAQVFVCACDMPFLNPRLVQLMASLADGYDVVIPQPGGVPEPTHAIYSRSALPAIERLIQKGGACPLDFLPDVRIRLLGQDDIELIDPQGQSLFNINREQEWAQVRAILAQGETVRRISEEKREVTQMGTVPVVSVVGKSNVGKTTLIEKLLPELKRRGYRVATVKHDAHQFELDQPGKDTWRHAQAGSDCVVIASRDKMATIERLENELSLDEIIARLPPVDIVLTEGYKRQGKPKIEVSRREMGSQLLCTSDQLICLATDQPFSLGVPEFDINDAAGIVTLLEELYLQPNGALKLTVPAFA